MKVLFIDPGAESPGYAIFDSELDCHTYVGRERPIRANVPYDVVVVESGFVGRIGRQGMWGLGFGAAWRAAAASFNGSLPTYTIRPDGKSGWRAALIERPGCFKQYDGPPKAVVISRLRDRYNAMSRDDRRTEDWTDDMVEACGGSEAAAAILARPKASQRKALKPVMF